MTVLLVGTLGVETFMDQHLCKQAATLVLPKPSQRDLESVVSALVQIDSTFGITPCQYRAMKKVGQKYKDLTDADLANKFDPSSVKLDAGRTQAIQELYSASGVDFFGAGGRGMSWAYNLGRSLGAPVRAAAMLTAEAIGLGFTVFTDVWNAGIDQMEKDFDHAVRIFDDLWYDVAGRWLYETGEYIDDVWHDSVANSFDFFNGVAVGILGPSVEGRRRVVYDKDCDFIMTEVDSIENECAHYRYERFANLVPALQSGGRADSSMVTNRTRLNTTFTGDIESSNPGLRELFTEQRQALYGVNGTCLHPNGASLSQASSNLTMAIFRLNSYLVQVHDTDWTNVDRINARVQWFYDSIANQFSTGVVSVFNRSLGAYKELRKTIDAESINMTYGLRSRLSNIVNSVNGDANVVNDLLTNSEEHFEDSSTVEKQQLQKLQKRLSDLSDKLDETPRGLDRFIDSFVNGFARILRAGISDAQLDGLHLIQNFMKPPLKKILDKYTEQSAHSVDNEEKSWSRSLIDFVRNVIATQLIDRQRLADRAASDLSSRFDSTSVDIDELVSTLVSEQSSRIGAVQLAASRLASVLQGTQSSASNTLDRRKKIFEELMRAITSSVVEAQRKIGELIAASSQSINGQLNDDIDAITQSGASINQGEHELMSALNSLAARLRRAIADALVAAEGAAASRHNAIETSAALASSDMDKHKDSWGQFVSHSTDDWQGMTERIGDSLTSITNGLGASQQGYARDVQSALAETKDVVNDGNDSAHVTALEDISKTRENEAITGQATSFMSKMASGYLGGIAGLESANIHSISSLRNARISTEAAIQDSVAILSDQVAELDSVQAADFGSGAHYALNHAKSAISRDESNVLAQVSNLETDLSNRLTDITVTPGAGSSLDSPKEADIEASYNEMLDSVQKILRDTDQIRQSINSTYPKGLDMAGIKSSTVADQVVNENVEGSETIISEITSSLTSALKQSSVIHGFTPVSSSVNHSDGIYQASSLVAGLTRVRTGLEDAMHVMNEVRHTADSGSAGMAAISKPLIKLTQLNQTTTDAIANISAALTKWLVSYSSNTTVTHGFNRIHPFTGFSVDSLGPVFDEEDGTSSMDALIAAGEAGDATIKWLGKQRRQTVDRNYLDDVRTDLEANVNGGRRLNESRTSLVDGQLTRLDGEVSEYIGRSGSELNTSVDSSRTALSFFGRHNEAEDQYIRSLYDAQTLGILHMGNRTAKHASTLEKDLRIATDSVQALAKGLVAGVAEGMAGFTKKLNSGLEGFTYDSESARSNFSGILHSDTNQLQIQLMMARKSLKDILASWRKYSDYANDKFEILKGTETRAVALTRASIDHARNAGSYLLDSAKDSLHKGTDYSIEAVNNFSAFTSETNRKISLYEDGLRSLNFSSDASLRQIKEMESDYLDNDAFLDERDRSDAEKSIKYFESDLDNTANLAIRSIR